MKIQQQANTVWDQFQNESKDTLLSLSALANDLGQQPGTRVLVLTSSGFITEKMHDQLNQTIDSALRAGVVINSLDAKGVYGGDGSVSDNEPPTGDPRLDTWRVRTESAQRFSLDAIMETVADGTGGTFVHGSNDLTAEVAQIASPPNVEYSLGFVPADLRYDGQFHSLKVGLRDPKRGSVTARPGYFAPDKPPVPVENQAQRDRLREELQATDELTALPTTFSVAPARSGQQGLQAVAAFEPGKLPLDSANGHRSDEITVIAALFDANGKMIIAREGDMSLHLRNETAEYIASAHGSFRAFVALDAPPGAYRLRIVALDSAKGQIATFDHNLTLP